VALPGGCDLGPRPIDLHLRALERLGAKIHVAHGYMEASCPQLVGAEVELDYPSHGATENAVMAGVLASGRTVIRNAAREPEIDDLVRFLQGMGANITGRGTPVLEIEGVDVLRASEIEVMPDRMEAGGYLFMAAAAGGDVTVAGAEVTHLEIVLDKLREAGVEVDVSGDEIRVRAEDRPLATDISTLPYPGFPTDLYPLAAAFLTRARGLSIVTENIFDGRFTFTDELRRMGADVHVEGHYVVIRGAAELTGAPVRATDLRAGASLVVAGLAASGRTEIEDVYHIDRGFQGLEERLAGVGARIHRVTADELTRA
jgi:UDP-N-acetylglucosamine 1-carboxyvinyltransferase